MKGIPIHLPRGTGIPMQLIYAYAITLFAVALATALSI
jgi:hypothetical protein